MSALAASIVAKCATCSACRGWLVTASDRPRGQVLSAATGVQPGAQRREEVTAQHTPMPVDSDTSMPWRRSCHVGG
jgi:hypothetical protein